MKTTQLVFLKALLPLSVSIIYNDTIFFSRFFFLLEQRSKRCKRIEISIKSNFAIIRVRLLHGVSYSTYITHPNHSMGCICKAIPFTSSQTVRPNSIATTNYKATEHPRE